MADKRISQLVDRGTIANNDVVPIVVSGASTTNKATISSIQTFMQGNLDLGVTSVGLSMPSAFVVTNSPVTSSGNISVTGAGTVSQYIRGDGSLADFPQGGGGGSSVNYYLNGSVSQGTIGGIAYQEMNKTPVLGAGTDFVAIADGYLASFITDAGDPSLLEIPAGNWNFETYFSASSGGGTPTFYVELYKVNSGGTATLIASNSGTPELIAFGTTITPYFSTLAVPTTALAITDRLALRYYVARSGRTITLHTENSHLCQIITTFTTGLTALNGLTAQVQNFATGTSGTDFAISSSVSTHTFNLPDASASARGVVTTGTQTFAGYKIFTGTISANNDIQLAAAGTSSTTFIKNISGAGLTSVGSNGFGFNNSDNIYFSGSNKGGGIISFSNTGNQTYTLQDASGTLAFTSQIPANPVGGTGAAGRVAYWNGSGTITSDSLFQWNDTFRRLGIGCTPTVSLDVVGAGAFTGALSLGGALNGTSASFSGYITGAGSNPGGLGGSKFVLDWLSGSMRVFSYGADASTNGGFVFNSQRSDGTNSQNFLSIASTGAATFSSSVGVGLSGTPAKTLEVRGALAISNSSSSYWYMDRDDSDGRFKILTDTDNERLSILTSGNVGIGTASPSRDAGTRSLAVSGGGSLAASLDLYGSARNFAIFTGGTGALSFYDLTDSTERMRITSGGDILLGATSFPAGERMMIQKTEAASLGLDRRGSDGGILRFYQDGLEEGNVTISGTTVSYNGGHLSRWSQTESNERIEGLVKGTVMSNLDQMAVWINPETGEPYENEQLNCIKISDIEGDKNVAGVFVNWDNDDQIYTNDINIAMTGDMIIRIAEGVVVEKGDLLISAGDGTAMPQSDDLIRSNTIAKVTSNHVTCVYEDGSYCVPCVLMAC